MAEFIAKCSHCNTEFQAQEEWIGKDATCPFCKKIFTVNKDIALKTPFALGEDAFDFEKDNPDSNSFVFVCPECGTQEKISPSLNGTKYKCKACCEEVVVNSVSEKKCPSCGQMIKAEAIICKYCRTNIEPQIPTSVVEATLAISPATSTDVDSWKIKSEDISKIKRYFYIWIPCAIGGYGFSSFWVGIPLALIAVVFECLLVYKFWSLVPRSKAEITPKRAVLFAFIPVYRFFWIYKLSKHYDALSPSSLMTVYAVAMFFASVVILLKFIPLFGWIPGSLELLATIGWLRRMVNIATTAIPVADE